MLSLFSCEIVFVVAVKIRAGVVRTFKETIHLVLVKVHKASVALVFLVVNIIGAVIAN